MVVQQPCYEESRLEHSRGALWGSGGEANRSVKWRRAGTMKEVGHLHRHGQSRSCYHNDEPIQFLT